jgi:hypothetical protein
MKVETLEIFGFYSTIVKALRLPFKGQHKSDTYVEDLKYPVQNDSNFMMGGYAIKIGPNDLRLLSNLVLNGDEHAKAVRGIIVSAEIDAPRYWWQEMDTYRVGTDRLSSESTMHCEAKGLSGEELQKVKAELKEGHVQRRDQIFSYQTLRRIYFQRKSHRLPEWHTFCEWIEQLPLSKQLIIISKGEKNV